MNVLEFYDVVFAEAHVCVARTVKVTGEKRFLLFDPRCAEGFCSPSCQWEGPMGRAKPRWRKWSPKWDQHDFSLGLMLIHPILQIGLPMKRKGQATHLFVVNSVRVQKLAVAEPSSNRADRNGEVVLGLIRQRSEQTSGCSGSTPFQSLIHMMSMLWPGAWRFGLFFSQIVLIARTSFWVLKLLNHYSPIWNLSWAEEFFPSSSATDQLPPNLEPNQPQTISKEAAPDFLFNDMTTAAPLHAKPFEVDLEHPDLKAFPKLASLEGRGAVGSHGLISWLT